MTGTSARGFAIRRACTTDLAGLLALEAQFPGDRMSARQFRRHLQSPTADVLVGCDAERVLAAAIVFRRRHEHGARLYSLVVDSACRGRGFGQIMLAAAEQAARARGCTHMRLEVRADNAAAQHLYCAAGYQMRARLPGYYADGGDGLRLHKPL